MILIIKDKAVKEDLEKMGEEYGGYIKVVVDLEQKILAGGGEYHTDGEQILLKEEKSKQSSLWGGGFDPKTGEIDYNSMINIRPIQGNPGREVVDPEIRQQMDEIIKDLLVI